MDPLRTERLTLVAMTPQLLRAEQAGYVELSHALDAEVAVDWPPEHWEPHVFGFIERQYADDPSTLGWNRYVLLRRDSERPVLIGTNGAFRRSSEEAEIGYSIVPGYQRRGYATEATLAFMEWLFATQSLCRISAQTFPHLTASLSVMKRCGMQFAGAGDEPEAVRYRAERPQV